MPTVTGVMRSFWLLALAASCDQGRGRPSPPAEPAPGPSLASAADAAVPTPVDASVAEPPLAYASVAEFLGLAAKSPSDRLAGYQLGQPAGPPRPIAIAGWWANARAVSVAGVVTHIIVELAPDDDNAANALMEVEQLLRTAWGVPQKGTRGSWRGSAAQLFAVEYDGFLRGTSSLVIDLLPLGDDHVCGRRDNFAAFFSDFKKALTAKDASALARLTVADPDNDMQTCIDDAGNPALACIATLRKRLPPNATCNLSQEVYYWRTIEKMHGGAYFVFKRDAGTWDAQGPIAIGHDDNPEWSSP